MDDAHDVLLDRDNPWPGLPAFPEAAEELFNGRDAERDDLTRLIRREMLTLLYGHSGLGKTSLLMAGLFPVLRRDNFLPVYIRIDHTPTSPAPTEQMQALLLEACAHQQVDAPEPKDGGSLWEYLHRKGRGFWSQRNHPVTPVFVIDQFEELLTLGRGTPARDARADEFLRDLGDLVNNVTPAALEARLQEYPEEAAQYAFRHTGYRIVIGTREDFVPELEQYLRPITSSLMQSSVRVSRMSGRQAYDAILRAGQERRKDGLPDLVAPDVARRIVRFLAGAGDPEGAEEEVRLEKLAVEPALLSVFCRELNEKRKARGQAVIESDLIRVSKEAILSDFYERSISDLGLPVRQLIEDELLTGSGHRDSRALDDVLRRSGVTREAVDALIARRLLRLEDRFGVKRVELTHDVLTGIVRESRDARRYEEEQIRLRDQQRAARQRVRRLAVQLGLAGAMVWAVALWYGSKVLRLKERADTAQAKADSTRARADTLLAKAEETRRRLVVEREILDQFKRLSVKQVGDMRRSVAFLVNMMNEKNPPSSLKQLTDLGLTPGRLPSEMPHLPPIGVVSGTLGNGQWHAAWRFDGERDQRVAFSLKAAFDTYLYLFDGRSGQLLSSDDDGGRCENSLIRHRLPARGTYVVVASSVDGRRAGSFDLSADPTVVEVEIASLQDLGLTPDSLPPGLPELRSGTTEEATLGPSTGVPVTRRPHASWVFRGRAGDGANFGVRSSDFEPYLNVFNAATGELLGSHDYGCGDSNALVPVRLPQTTTYLLVVTAANAGGRGAYVLSHAAAFLRAENEKEAMTLQSLGLAPAQIAAQGAELRRGARVAGALEPQQEYVPWLFDGSAGDRVAFGLHSEAFDALLYLFRLETGELVAEDDDGGEEGLDALIRTTLPASGRYVVLVASADADRGPYALSAERW